MNFKFFLAGFLIILSACSVKEDLCAAYLCEAPMVHLKLRFKDSSNKDLLFSTNPLYSQNDLKVRSSLFTEDLKFRIDSTDKSTKFIVISASYSQSLTIKLGDKPEDVIQIETLFKEARCCETINVLSVKLNQTAICTNCTSIEPIILIK